MAANKTQNTRKNRGNNILKLIGRSKSDTNNHH